MFGKRGKKKKKSNQSSAVFELRTTKACSSALRLRSLFLRVGWERNVRKGIKWLDR